MKWIIMFCRLILLLLVVDGTLSSSFGLSSSPKHHGGRHRSKVVAANSAYLTINTSIETLLDVFKLSKECYRCHRQLICQISKGSKCSAYVDTRWPTTLTLLMKDNSSESCTVEKLFETQAKYILSVEKIENIHKLSCKLSVIKAPENIYIALLTAASVVVGIAILVQVTIFLYRKGVFNKIIFMWKSVTYSTLSETGRDITRESGSMERSNSSSKVKKRLRSLDTFRGLSLTIMIFVNYGGGQYWFFKHSTWNGLTVADLVFPWFMWIMGVSMTFSLKSLLRRCLPRWLIFIKICRRSFILFSLGIIMNSLGNNDLDHLRIPGVLQRFGVAYFVVCTTELFFSKAGDVTQHNWYSIGESTRDKLKYFLEWFIIGIFPTVHLLVTFLLKVPSCPTGYLGPGGKHVEGMWTNCTGGAAGYIDRIVFGENHIYQSPTCKYIYDTTVAYDPEGLLGVLTSIFLVFMGVKAGKILVTYQNPKVIIAWWSCWALTTGAIAGILCKFSKNEGWIPINKNLWSLSFVLAMASFAFILLIITYIIVDIKGWWTGSPFVYPGLNSILVYVGSEITGKMFPWSWQTGSSHWENLFCDVWGAAFWVLISMWLHWHNFFLAI